MRASQGRAPPGRSGWPLLGEIADFIGNPYAFFTTRRARYGPVFRTNLLGEDVYVLSGADGWAAFCDEATISRSGALFPFVQALLGGENIGMLDGPRHRDRRGLVEPALSREALAAYLPLFQRLAEEHALRWAARGELALMPELKHLALASIAGAIVGEPPGPRLSALLRDYETMLGGMLAVPLALPGTPYRRSQQAVQRVLRFYREAVRGHRGAAREDGLSRMLAASHAGTQLGDEEAVFELHHLTAGGLVVYALLAAIVLRLAEQADVLAALRDEVRRECPAGPVEPAQLARLPLLGMVVMEIKRTTPVVTAIFGRARRPFEVAGFRIPGGVRVLMAVHASNIAPESFSHPEAFDPQRFAADRREHDRRPYAYAPQGAGPHQCVGADFATCLCQAFAIALLRDYRWQPLAPGAGYAWNRLVPEPRDGLVTRIERVAPNGD